MGNGFEALVRAAAPLWAAEGELIEGYFASSERTVATDLHWLRAQCGKELVDGVELRRDALAGLADDLGDPGARARAIGEAQELVEELAHLDAFATAYGTIRGPADPELTSSSVRDAARWPENVALAALRARDRARSPRLGSIAQAFTEGGCATLYAAGMALAGTARDDAIARACAAVYEDEVHHMRAGAGGLADAVLDGAEWAELTDMVVGQLRARLPMRDAQFAGLADPARLDALLAGAARPRPADLARVGLSGSGVGAP
ncbi:MAG: hypothetical protein R2702_12645 [Acidimicrobiales bacterium]